MKLTDEEYEAVIRELSERVKDIVFMNAERKVRDALPKEFLEELLDKKNDTESISISYMVCFAVGDIYQIIGRMRRKRTGIK